METTIKINNDNKCPQEKYIKVKELLFWICENEYNGVVDSAELRLWLNLGGGEL